MTRKFPRHTELSWMVSFCIVICGAYDATVVAEEVSLSVFTRFQDLEISEIDGYDLIELNLDRASLQGDPGEPFLPYRDLPVLLPRGTKATSVAAAVQQQSALDGQFVIYPAQPEVPTDGTAEFETAEPSTTVYASTDPMRPAVVELLDTVTMRGYRIAIVRVWPIDYVPADGRLILRERIELTIHVKGRSRWKAAAAESSLRYRRSSEAFRQSVQASVINPEAIVAASPEVVEPEAGMQQQMEPDAPLGPLDATDVEYLLIGDATMFDEFQPLLDWKTQKGIPAEAIDVNAIYATYSGADNQEKIKACIKDYVENKGTVWVVLAGDNTIVPDRDCYGKVNGDQYTDTTIPTDLYYAGLDDMNWDDDGDGIGGEVDDDTIDMAADVYVGRFPIRTEAHAIAIVNKTLDYEKNLVQPDFAEKMLLSGDKLWNTGDAEAKSEKMYTEYIQPHWSGTRYRFYDTATDFAGGPDYHVTDDHVNEQLELGYNFFHMATHGNQTIWGMESGSSYSSYDANNASNINLYGHVLTMACITNAFENGKYGSEPCLSEAFIRNPGGGAVSYIGSSRYGWGYSTLSSHGTSLKYDRMFYKFLFTGEPVGYPQRLGAVYQQMKTYWAGSCNWYGSYRWCQFAINLMGDPELPIYTYDPGTLNPIYPTAVNYRPQLFSVDIGVADALVCLMQDGYVYTYGKADANGTFEAPIDPEPGVMQVTITAPNYYPYEGQVTIEDGCPADFDKDDDVDLIDYAHLQKCMSGTLQSQDDPACQSAKLAGRDYIDQQDVNLFLNCLTGPNVQADLGCMD